MGVEWCGGFLKGSMWISVKLSLQVEVEIETDGGLIWNPLRFV
jgi:hypothetical protein